MDTDNTDPALGKEESYATATRKLDGRKAAAAIKTRDHDVIRQWAARHQAVPATGEATSSGPATSMKVTDGGVGLRFNFPGFARFREIAWDEWFAHFDQHQLTFIYEEETSDRAYDISQARGGAPGHDRDDWLEAERQLGGPAGGPIGRYRIAKADEI